MDLQKERQEFEKQCLGHFGFLINEYGFGVISTEILGGYGGYKATFANDLVAIGVRLDYEYSGIIIVDICRLSDGKIRPNPIDITDESELWCFTLQDFMELRMGDGKALEGYPGCIAYVIRGLIPRRIDPMMTKASRQLVEYAGDVLAGDMAVFTDLERLVKDRIRKYRSGG